MNICMILKNNDLLFDNRVQKEATSLADAGHKVTVLAKKTGRSKLHEHMGTVEVLRIPTHFWDPRRLFLEAAVDRQADVYHAHDLYALDIAVVAALKTNALVVYDSHELWTALLRHYWHFRYVRRLFYWMRERFLICKADAAMTVSDSIARVLQKKYRLNEVVVVRNVPPPALGSPKKELRELLPILPDQKIVLHIGSLTEARGIPIMMKALTLCDRLVFVCIGPGLIRDAYLSKMKKLAQKLEIEERVFFLPYMPYEEMIAYSASADFGYCLIQPITPHYYLTLANKFFDYFLAGLPVIASDFPEMKNLIERYHVGRAIAHDDPNALVRVLTELIENPRVYEEMKKNTTHALEENNWSVESKKLLNLYDRLSKKTVSFHPPKQQSSSSVRSDVIVLSAGNPSREALDNLKTLMKPSHMSLAIIGSSAADTFNDGVDACLPLRSPAEFLKFMKIVAPRRHSSKFVTIYQKSSLWHFILLDLLLLPAILRRKFVYFPQLNLLYRISANIFLHKYLNRLETKIYFLIQFLRALRRTPEGASGRGHSQ